MLHKIDAQRPGTFEILSRKAQQLDGSAATATIVNGRSRMLVALDGRQIDHRLLLRRARDRQSVVEIPIGRAPAGAYGRRRIRTDGCAQGGAGCGRFRHVPTVAARSKQPATVRFYSCRVAGPAALIVPGVATRPSQMPQKPRHDPDANATMRGGFRRCRPPPTESDARRGFAAHHCPGTGCRNPRPLPVPP
jgi:hypothetical protein